MNHGNGGNWESMHFTPQSMTQFVNEHLGPQLEADFNKNIVILGYDQNRQELKEWVDEMYKDLKKVHITMGQPFIGMRAPMITFQTHYNMHTQSTKKYFITNRSLCR